jgi:cyanate lyase
MNHIEARKAILEAKTCKKVTWHALATAVGLSKEYVCSACLGMNRLDADSADAVARMLDLGPDVSAALQQFTYKNWGAVVPTDPVIYRWYEIVGVYGETIKELIHEEFGDGIMSAIDFTMDIQRVEDPRGDRVKVTLNGKFLPYRSW